MTDHDNDSAACCPDQKRPNRTGAEAWRSAGLSCKFMQSRMLITPCRPARPQQSWRSNSGSPKTRGALRLQRDHLAQAERPGCSKIRVMNEIAAPSPAR